jgi:glycosyltransferase involved in cell wall biosynthesis
VKTPDVSVVVAVYNTMPYLRTCLTSLVDQSIGRDRMEIILVDDGSTDGSAAEIDRFARRYPDLITVIHQLNSGGPAAPSNRGLEKATGRYVFFVGADDYLGTEALQRLVSAADGWSSDVVLGRMVGVNGRGVPKAVFASTEADITLADSPLPFAMSNTKLFRRELIEKHGLHYPEDMPVGSDQFFTLGACVHARRISVLADYDYYFAVRRLNARNITYQTSHDERLRFVGSITDFVTQLLEPGEVRDAVLLRHFKTELAKMVRDDFLNLDRAIQQRVHDGLRGLARRHLNDNIRGRLPVPVRLRLSLPAHGDLDDLLTLIRTDTEQGGPSIVFDGGRAYAAYPGFRDGPLGLPDSWFDITDALPAWSAGRFEFIGAAWHRRRDAALTISIRQRESDTTDFRSARIRVMAGDVPAQITETNADGRLAIHARFAVGALMADRVQGGAWCPVHLQLDEFESTGDAPLRVAKSTRLAGGVGHVVIAGFRPYRLALVSNVRGNLLIVSTPVTLRRIAGRLQRLLSRGGGR